MLIQLTSELLNAEVLVRSVRSDASGAVVLFYGVDLSVRDVAKAMDCREGTARAHLARARTTLEAYLGGEIDAAGRAAPRAD